MNNPIPYPHLAARLFNRPLLITPEKARVLVGVFAGRARLSGRVVVDGRAADLGEQAAFGLAPAASSRSERKPYPVADGIAVVEISGTLVSKLGSMDPWSGMTGYDGLIVKIETAAADPDVRGILLDVDSPGGEVHSSLQECAAAIRAAKAAKPVWAVCSDFAYSAAYWLAAQADRVVVPPTGGVGSVGVVCMHVDYSRMLDAEGLTVTLIHAGARKVDGNPFEPLPKDVRAEIQKEIEAVRTLFAEAVAEGRALTAKAVLATEARCFDAEGALAVRFADAVMTPDEAFLAFVDELDRPLASAASSRVARLGSRPSKNVSSGSSGGHLPPQSTKESSMPKNIAAASDPEVIDPKKAAAASEDESPDENDDEKNEEEDENKKDGAKEDAAGKDGEKDDNKDEEKDESKSAAASRAAKSHPMLDAAFVANTKQERARIAAILTAPEAKGRDALARHFALETDMSVDAAKKALAAAPKESSLDAAMAARGDSVVGDASPTQPRDNGWGRSIAKVCGTRTTH